MQCINKLYLYIYIALQIPKKNGNWNDVMHERDPRFLLVHNSFTNPMFYMINIGIKYAMGQPTYQLTHWGRDKMAAIFQTIFQMHFLEWKCMNFVKDFTEVCS